MSRVAKIFASFRLDPVNQCLWREGDQVPLAPKPFAVLCYLVDHAGRLVTQEELLEALWPKTYVQPEVLRTYILELRKALGDRASEPRFIRTFPKRGYQFLAPVTESATPAGAPVAVEAPIGREAQLAELTYHFEAALDGRRRIVFVSGESGIGKTTLMDAFGKAMTEKAGVSIGRGQCLEGFGGKEAYYPVLEALGRLGSGVIQTLSRQAPTWLIQFPALLTAGEREALQKEIFGATRERMLREICEALEAFTSERPLILMLEDLHWADHSTLDLISALARRRAPAKLLLLCTFRAIDVILSKSPLQALKQDLLIHGLCHEIALRGLAEPEVARYLTERLPHANLPQELARMVHRHSGGNPMFMIAIVDELLKTGAIGEHKGRLRLGVPLASLHMGVPETMRQMLDLQIEQLDPSERRVLQCASVAGARFSARFLSPVLGLSTAQVEQTCEALLKRQQFIQHPALRTANGPGPAREGGDKEGAYYEFRHSLYREAFYFQLAPAARADFHRTLAEQMESTARSSGAASPNLAGAELASELAVHFEHALDYERAAHYLALSAANAARRFAHRDSVQALTHALELLARVPTEEARKLEISVLEKLSDAHYAMGEMTESAEADRRVAELARDLGMVTEQVDALARLARALAFLDPDGCVTVCERAEEICAERADPLLHARSRLLAACWRVVNNGWNAEDSRICAQARKLIRRLHGADLPAYYEILYAHVQSIQGEYVEACKTADAGIPASVETHSLVVYLSALSSKTLALLHLGSWGELRRVAQTAIDMTVKNGNEPWEGVFRAIVAWLSLEATDLEGARRLAGDLLKIYDEEPPGQVRTMALLVNCFANLRTGRPAEAVDTAVDTFVKLRDRVTYPKFFLQWYWKMMAQMGLAMALLESGDQERARAESDRFREAALATADPALKARAWDLEARIALRAGDATRARECVEAALAALKPAEPPAAAWRVHSTAAHVFRQSGDTAAAASHRLRAQGILRQLADSLDSSDPLRAALLKSAGRLEP
ncbi:MAG TPA: AAA family ATPase [Bryobacteraceae bacterium]